MSVVEEIKEKIKEVGGSKEQITELTLSGIKISRFTPEVTKLLEQCKKLEMLTMSDCELESLENFPKLKLKGLDISNNKLTDADLKHLKSLSILNQLILSENNFEKVEAFSVLESFKNLSDLDLVGNPAVNEENYRKFFFDTIPSLTSLDGKDINGEEIEEEDEQSDGQDDDSESFQGDEDDEQEDYDAEDDESEQPKPKKKGKGK